MGTAIFSNTFCSYISNLWQSPGTNSFAPASKLLMAAIVAQLAAWDTKGQWQPDNSHITANNLVFISANGQKHFLIECDVFQSSWSSNWLMWSADGGSTWNNSIGSEMCPRAAFFVNGSTGYIITIGSALDATAMRKTTDGGITWSTIPYTFPTYNQKGLFFIDENNGYYGSGDGFTIHKTTDGGMSWSAVNTGANNAVIDAIHFFDKKTGIIAGWYGPKIAKTTDGGNTWKDVSNKYGVYAMHFPSATTGFAVGSTSTNTPVIIKTTDAGDTWKEVYTGSLPNKPFFFSSVYCLDNNTCYAIGDSGTILKTKNGGATWQQETSGTFRKLNSISCTNNRECYIAGDSGTFLKNMTETGIPAARNNAAISIYPNPVITTATIQLPQSMSGATMNIYDLYGRKLKQINGLTGDTFTFNRQELPPGNYFLVIRDGGHIINGRCIVE